MWWEACHGDMTDNSSICSDSFESDIEKVWFESDIEDHLHGVRIFSM